ncbi:FYVE zinc finger [Trypanosoma vivax]|nr:putative zinc finger protein [Trypanosoma vivax]KAH8611806.1 FYVE zinc finger [Trypanosoma vivax]
MSPSTPVPSPCSFKAEIEDEASSSPAASPNESDRRCLSVAVRSSDAFELCAESHVKSEEGEPLANSRDGKVRNGCRERDACSTLVSPCVVPLHGSVSPYECRVAMRDGQLGTKREDIAAHNTTLDNDGDALEYPERPASPFVLLGHAEEGGRLLEEGQVDFSTLALEEEYACVVQKLEKLRQCENARRREIFERRAKESGVSTSDTAGQIFQPANKQENGLAISPVAKGKQLGGKFSHVLDNCSVQSTVMNETHSFGDAGLQKDCGKEWARYGRSISNMCAPNDESSFSCLDITDTLTKDSVACEVVESHPLPRLEGEEGNQVHSACMQQFRKLSQSNLMDQAGNEACNAATTGIGGDADPDISEGCSHCVGPHVGNSVCSSDVASQCDPCVVATLGNKSGNEKSPSVLGGYLLVFTIEETGMLEYVFDHEDAVQREEFRRQESVLQKEKQHIQDRLRAVKRDRLYGGTRYWQSNESADVCPRCAKEFSFTVRKHHCRRCGELLCNDCCSQVGRDLYMSHPSGRAVQDMVDTSVGGGGRRAENQDAHGLAWMYDTHDLSGNADPRLVSENCSTTGIEAVALRRSTVDGCCDYRQLMTMESGIGCGGIKLRFSPWTRICNACYLTCLRARLESNYSPVLEDGRRRFHVLRDEEGALLCLNTAWETRRAQIDVLKHLVVERAASFAQSQLKQAGRTLSDWVHNLRLRLGNKVERQFK